MTSSHDDLLKMVYGSQAISIWNHRAGPVFWYAAGVPGPFYCNTEKLIGADAASMLLDALNSALAGGGSPEEKQARIKSAVMDEYARNADLRRLTGWLADVARNDFDRQPAFISGGERRDWIFSFPVAHALGLPHITMFKDSGLCLDPAGDTSIGEGANILHVSDLVNNAASFFDLWLPILEKHGAKPYGSLSLVNRGRIGMDKLDQSGVTPRALLSIDLDLFQKSLDSALVTGEQFDELDLYYRSPRQWAERYIAGNADLIGAELLEEKSRKRMESFFTADPWGMKSSNPDFFSATLKTLGLAA